MLKNKKFFLISIICILTFIVLVKLILLPTGPTQKETATPEKEQLRSITYRVKSGDTFDSIFRKFGVKHRQGYELIRSLKGKYSPRSTRPGNEITFSFNNKGDLQEFGYKFSNAKIFETKSEDGIYATRKIFVPIEKEDEFITVVLKNSMYQAFLDKGKSPELVEKLVDLFAWDIDFFSDPRKGDRISVVVEKKSINGKFFRYGRIIAAHYDGGIVDQQAYYYKQKNGTVAYFDEKGRSLARNFLKTPVKFTRISSKFGRRRHPITHKLKNHLGTDYAAPTGTPVWAMASGKVITKSYNKYNGYYIKIRHSKGYTTSYLHLSKFAKGIYNGKRVQQKEIIGYVGTTGRSTGPHLHLGVQRHGRHINPLKLKKVKEKALAKSQLPAYKKQIAPLHAFLMAEKDAQYASKKKRAESKMELNQLIDMDIVPFQPDQQMSLSKRTDL